MQKNLRDVLLIMNKYTKRTKKDIFGLGLLQKDAETVVCKLSFITEGSQNGIFYKTLCAGSLRANINYCMLGILWQFSYSHKNIGMEQKLNIFLKY